MQYPLFQPETSWRAPALSRLPSWRYAKRVAVDVETKDSELTKLGPGCRRPGNYIAGVAFAIEDGPSFYLPVRHEAGGNLDPEKVFQYLRDQAKIFKGDLVGANLQYDLDWLAEKGVIYCPRFFKDVQIAEPLIDELQFKYSLDAIAGRHGIPGKDEDHMAKAAELFGFPVKKMKENIWRLPARHVGEYAEQDVRLPLQLLRRQEKIIDEQDLWKAFEMECRLLPILLKMRRRGVRIDFDKIEQIEAWSMVKEREALKELTRLTGVQLDVSDTTKATALAPCLEAVGITVPKTAKAGLPSIKTEFLKALDHEAGDLIMTAKKFNKLRNTFVRSIRRHAVGDRIHCTFNQLRRPRDDGSDDQGGRYGRMSCTDPNLQQQPARDPEIGPRWRGIYIPDEGGEWACLDFSQQEPRWLTHYAAISGCTGAAAARDEYRNNPDMDNHQFMADLTGLPRKEAKNIFLGKCIAKGTLVHTNNGLKPIESVTVNDWLWDGKEYVMHDGVIFSGVKKCINVAGTWLTPEHEIMTPDGWFQAQDLSTIDPPSEMFMADSPLKRWPWVPGEGSSPSNVVAPVVEKLLRIGIIWSPENQHAVMNVVKKRLLRHLRNTVTCQSPIVHAFLIELVQSLAAASRSRITDMGSVFTLPGSLIEDYFSTIWYRYQDGIARLSKSTGLTMMQGMNQETSDSQPIEKTCEIETYDIVNAGPRNRFVVDIGLLVSNCYGMGGAKFCRSLGLPTKTVPSRRLGKLIEVAGDEGQALLDTFDQKAPYVRELAWRAQQKAGRAGYIFLIDGRRCRFPARSTGGWDYTHKALNRLIQGSSAVQMKKAMVDAGEAGFRLQLQVHDEVDLTIYNRAEAWNLSEVMLNAVECTVPHKVDIEVGPSWGEIKKLDKVE